MLWTFIKFFANLVFRFMVLTLTPKWPSLFSDKVDGMCIITNAITTLAGVAQCFERWPENQRVASSIPSQGTCLGCGPGPQ